MPPKWKHRDVTIPAQVVGTNEIEQPLVAKDWYDLQEFWKNNNGETWVKCFLCPDRHLFQLAQHKEYQHWLGQFNYPPDFQCQRCSTVAINCANAGGAENVPPRNLGHTGCVCKERTIYLCVWHCPPGMFNLQGTPPPWYKMPEEQKPREPWKPGDQVNRKKKNAKLILPSSSPH